MQIVFDIEKKKNIFEIKIHFVRFQIRMVLNSSGGCQCLFMHLCVSSCFSRRFSFYFAKRDGNTQKQM